MQAAYEKMKSEMEQMKKDNDHMSFEFTSSKEQVQKLQEELASTKESKHRRLKNIGDVSSTDSLADEESSESEDLEDDAELKDGGTPEDDPPKEGDIMAKRMVMIEKRNRQMMWLFSQLLGGPTPCIVEHREGYAASLFVEEIAKAALPKKLNLPILTSTYDKSTDTTELVT